MMSFKTTMNKELDSRRSEAHKTPLRQSVGMSTRSVKRSPEDRIASRMGVVPPSSFDPIRNLEAQLQEQEVSQFDDWKKRAKCNYCHKIGHIKYDCPKKRKQKAVEDGRVGGQCDRRIPLGEPTFGEPTFREPTGAWSQTSPQDASPQRPLDNEMTRHKFQDHHPGVNTVLTVKLELITLESGDSSWTTRVRHIGQVPYVTEERLGRFSEELMKALKSMGQPKKQPDWKLSVQCRICQEIGHIQYDCPNTEEKPKRRNGKKTAKSGQSVDKTPHGQ